MKIKILLLTASLFLLLCSCNAQKEYAQRRNLMMPKKSDLPRNSKYSGSKSRNTYKVTKHKQKRSKKNFD